MSPEKAPFAPARSWAAVFLALVLLPAGLYFLHVFELCSKIIAAFSQLPASGRALPHPLEIALLASQAIVLAASFAPAIWLAFRRRFNWPWVAGFCVLFFGLFQYA